MPSLVVLVHDDPEFVESAASALEAAGYPVAAFVDPLKALEALEAIEAAGCAELLITLMEFAPGTVNGVSLACMAKRTRRGIRVIFTDMPELREHAEGLGEFLPMPFDMVDLVDAAGRALYRPAA
jgi:DNA-binding NtrC family response regulator